MAIAVHTVLSGETLQSIAATYFALQHPDGGSGTTIDDVRQSEVIRAIRSATPTSVFDLSSFLDADTLTTGNAVFVPALRQFNRQIYQDTVHTDLNPNLEALGYDHAGKLMAATSAEVITQLPSASVTYVDADVTRLWVLTQFLTLDGMDLATAEELYDNQSIQSMATLSLQSVASLQSILDSLVTGGKAPELSASAQRHAERWRAEAKLRARQVGGQVSRGKYRMLSIPAAPDEFTKRAVFYEAVADDSRNTRADTTMAGYLARLYRFHGAAVRGNQNVLAGRAEEARKAYMEARREMHRLVEDTGTSSSVDDEVGVNLETVVEAIKVVLQALPPEDDAPFGPPSMVFFNEGRVGRPHYRLRTFTEAELTGGEKNNLRNALTSVATHALPRRYRSALQQVALEKSRAQLDSASVSTGLLAADATALARDLEAQDKEVLRRNIAAASFSTIGSGGLNLADQVSDALVISEVQQLVGALWSGSDAAAIVEDSSPYPTGFLTSLDPFARFVILPSIDSNTQMTTSSHTHLLVDSSFTTNYRDQFLKPLLMSDDVDNLVMDEALWRTAGGLAAVAPVMYGLQVPMGIGQAAGALGDKELLSRFSQPLMNVYDSGGTAVADVWSGSPGLPPNLDLTACTTTWRTGASAYASMNIVAYASYFIGVADNFYRQDRREEAERWYRDVQCALEIAMEELKEYSRVALKGVYEAWANDVGDPGDRTVMNVQYTQGATTEKVMEDVFFRAKTSQGVQARSLPEVGSALTQYFGFAAPSGYSNVTIDTDPLVIEPDASASFISTPRGLRGPQGNRITTQTTKIEGSKEKEAEMFRLHLYCEAKLMNLMMGKNWLGYRNDYVPPWTFDHLYAEARNLCDRAMAAESQVIRFLEASEARALRELDAKNSTLQAAAQLDVATSAVLRAEAEADVRRTQAEIAGAQADLAKAQNWQSGITDALSGVGGLLTGNFASGLGSLANAAFAAANQAKYNALADLQSDATEAENKAADAAVAVADSEAVVADLALQHAETMAQTLSSQTLNSAGYAALLAISADIHNALVEAATELAWLCQRALSFQERRVYGFVGPSYLSVGEVDNLSQAQRLARDLELLRSTFVAGTRTRRQPLRWTVPMSIFAPGSLLQLRTSGATAFHLPTEFLDRFFPGFYLHALQGVDVRFVGTLPASGVRGSLEGGGVSQIRVPNSEAYRDGANSYSDWVVEALADATGETVPALTGYDGYFLKETVGPPVALALSEVSREAPGAPLPTGMLGAVQAAGLEGSWSIRLPRSANTFAFDNILDVELTFSFLAEYDPDLEAAITEAMVRLGTRGELSAADTWSGTDRLPGQWVELVATRGESHGADVRHLTYAISSLPAYSASELLQDIWVVMAGAAASSTALKFRLCSETEPVGVEVTPVDGFARSAVGVTPTPPDPAKNSALDSWVETNFYSGGSPDSSVSLRQTFVLKVSAERAFTSGSGSVWEQTDDDGDVVTSSWGALQAPASASTLVFDDGAAWKHVSVSAHVAHRSETLRLRVRDDGAGNLLALEIGPSTVSLVQVGSGSGTLETRSLSYPDEYLHVEVRVVGDTVSVWIDKIPVFTGVSANSGLPSAGTVGLEVTGSPSSQVVFDDIEVRRLDANGGELEQLLSEPFSGSVPSNWTASGGTWTVSSTGHPRLDLSQLDNLVVKFDHLYELNV